MVSALGVNTSASVEQLLNASFNAVAEEYIFHHQNKLEALVVQRQKHWNKLQLFAIALSYPFQNSDLSNFC